MLQVVASSLDADVPQREEGVSFFVSEKLKISEDLPAQAYKWISLMETTWVRM